MYLLEIELQRQERLFSREKGVSREDCEGDYSLEKRHDMTLLQQLAKECLLYEGLPSCEISTRFPSVEAKNNERLFQQQIEDSAQQLVTTLALQPLTIQQILQQLEQELPHKVPLGKYSSETDILRIVDSPARFIAMRAKAEIACKEDR